MVIIESLQNTKILLKTSTIGCGCSLMVQNFPGMTKALGSMPSSKRKKSTFNIKIIAACMYMSVYMLLFRLFFRCTYF